MEAKKIILKLNEEQIKILNQLEGSKSPLLMEVIIHGVNKIKAISYVVQLLQQGKTNFEEDRNFLIAQMQDSSPQVIPVDIIQIVHRLQVIFYVKELLEMVDEK